MALGCVALLFSSGANIIAPYFFGKVIDVANEDKDNKHALAHEVLLLGIIYLVGSVAAFFRSWLFTWAGQRLVARIRSKVFEAIIRQEVGFFDVNRTGELTNRLSSDTAVIQNGERGRAGEQASGPGRKGRGQPWMDVSPAGC